MNHVTLNRVYLFLIFQTIFRFSLIAKIYPVLIHKKRVTKGVHYRLVNQNTLSALDEMLALTNFDDIISNVNINKATQLLFDRINNAFKLSCPIRPLYLLKIPLNHGFYGRFMQISRKGKTIIHLLDKIKCPINSILMI